MKGFLHVELGATVEAELVCLEALETLDLDWKYALNAAGSELQLPNNRQLVELLTRNPGSVVVNSEPMPAKHMGRVRKKYELRGTQTFDSSWHSQEYR